MTENKIIHYKSIPGDTTSLSNNSVRSVFRDSNGNLWVGTNGGLNLFNPITQTFKRLNMASAFRKEKTQDGTKTKKVEDTYIYCINEVKKGELLIGTSGDGLLKFNISTQVFTNYHNNPNDSISITNNLISCIHKDKKGHIWVGTLGGGLNKMIEEQGKISFRSFTTYDGLSNNVIYGILEDKQEIMKEELKDIEALNRLNQRYQ